MNTSNWWNRYGSQVILLGLAILTAWLVRQTQGMALFELYYWVTRPFQEQTEELAEQQYQQAKQATPRLNELEARVGELERQNQELQKLLGYTASQSRDKGVVAPIIGRSPDHWWQQVVLGRGSQQGIQENDLVMAPGGLVGRIVSTTPNTSQVLLVSDPTSNIGVAVSRTRQMGYLRGAGTGQGTIEFFDNSSKAQPGDLVVTSAFSQLFPAGWPVGKIVSVKDQGPAPEAVVEFFVPLETLEWVVVYSNPKQPASSSPPSTPQPSRSTQTTP
ncbi:MAG: rod shape-determining protein MreC [Microcoleaceae cyanobacterium]